MFTELIALDFSLHSIVMRYVWSPCFSLLLRPHVHSNAIVWRYKKWKYLKQIFLENCRIYKQTLQNDDDNNNKDNTNYC